jgi:hypothetical protein
MNLLSDVFILPSASPSSMAAEMLVAQDLELHLSQVMVVMVPIPLRKGSWQQDILQSWHLGSR